METDEMTMRDLLILTEALYTILQESEEAETVRVAVGALTNTQAGMAYLQKHPVTL